MASWYTYTGGWWNNATYSFQTGENGDVLYLPYNCQSFIRRGDNLYFTVDGGNLNLQLSGSDYIKYSFDGYNVYRAKFADYGANFTWYDPNVDFYGFYNDSGALYVMYDGYNGADVRITDDLIRAKNLYALGGGNNILFGNSLDNRIVDSYGNSQIWGGYGNDTLKGGGGSDRFFFGLGSGNDVILDISWDDTIDLFNMTSSEFFNGRDNSFEYNGWNEVTLNLNDGSSLKVYASSGLTPYFVLQFADGAMYDFNGYSLHNLDYSYDTAQDTGADIAANPLWGNANEFFGTAEADNIFISRSDGNDLVFDADSADTVHLYDAALSDIVSTSVSDNAIAIEFNTGEVAMVSATENVSPTFKLASGESYVYNRESSSWREA